MSAKPGWRNWQTRWSQTPVGNRAGSTPAPGTKTPEIN